MSIVFIGPSGACEFPWIQYALLRDNVLHHLEKADAPAQFGELVQAGESLGGRTVRVSALRLHEQAARAQALCTLPIDALAVSAETRAILFMQPAAPQTHAAQSPFHLVRLPWLSGEMDTLGDIFEVLCAELLEITRGATESDLVEVVAAA